MQLIAKFIMMMCSFRAVRHGAWTPWRWHISSSELRAESRLAGVIGPEQERPRGISHSEAALLFRVLLQFGRS